MSTRILVCGGRTYGDAAHVNEVLDGLQKEFGGCLTIIQGGATGADALAFEWAWRQPTIHLINEPVTKEEWRKLGRAAGPLRNQRMLDEHKPTLVIAFPGGSGTADMTRRALEAGIEVRTAPLPGGGA